jgi:hypothetical protein
MIHYVLAISFLFILDLYAFSQVPLDTSAIQKQLAAIYDRDQKTRARGDSTEFVQYIDSCNQAQAADLISKYGWMGRSTIGPVGNYTLFLVIQHAELPMQEKYLPMLQQSVDQGESRTSDLAMLQDRILMRQDKKQIYGSQVVFNQITGDPEFYPIEDEKNVNVRRAKVGLEPLEEYATHFGITYQLPTE